MNKKFEWLKTNKEEEFKKKVFHHNNTGVLVVALFLSCQQLLYGLFIREPSSLLGKIHLFTSIVSLCFAIAFIKLKKSDYEKIKKYGHGLIISGVLFGFFIAVARGVYANSHENISIPIIYIALIYGMAFIFYFSPAQSFFIYSFVSTLFITLNLIYNPDVIFTTFIPDIISNNILAFMASVINYKRYDKEYLQSKIIKNKNIELIKQSETDMLTKAANRRLMDRKISEYHEIANKAGLPYSILLIDIDHFKLVNDTYGHHAGDDVLIEFVNLISSHIRKNDLLGRWGGEEFIILCKDTDLKDAKHLGEKLRKIIATHNFPYMKTLTCSIGAASNCNSALSPSDIIRLADEALYKAKELGRNKVLAAK